MDSNVTWEFESWADRYDGIVASNNDLYARYDEVLDAVVDVARISPGQLVLDIGTGTGNLAARCLDHGAIVTAVDPSQGMLAVAAVKIGNHPCCQLQQVDQPFLELPYADRHFDAIVSTYDYHHIPHDEKPAAIAEMLRVLRPGGVWAIGDLAFMNWEAEQSALREYGDWLEQEYFTRIEELGLIFSQCGMHLSSRQFTPVTWMLWAAKE